MAKTIIYFLAYFIIAGLMKLFLKYEIITFQNLMVYGLALVMAKEMTNDITNKK